MYTKHNLTDTIVALATPPGIGAIGVIRLSGASAISIADAVFYGKKLEKQASHTIHFGTIRDFLDKKTEPANHTVLGGNQKADLSREHREGVILDEVLVSIFKAPKSYTKENVVEISTHGSPYIQQQIIQLLLKHGARLAQPGEFTLRAFLNGQLDLSQAEAVADLIASTSEASHTLAMQQMRGGFSEKIKILRGQLINFASLIELELDFGEEDVEFANREDLRALVIDIQQVIKKLTDSFALGNVLKNGVLTVIAGRPNAGKSTLLNVLLNEERAIVSDIAGTTRDTIEEVLNIEGVVFRLVDTAGIREATDQIEAIGVKKTMEKVSQSAILVYVFDVTDMKIDEVLADLQQLVKGDMKVLVVCNKMDKNPYFRPEWLSNPNDSTIPDFYFSEKKGTIDPLSISTIENVFTLENESVITLSAKENMNIGYLKEKLLALVTEGKIGQESTIVSNARHFEALQNSYASLDAVLHGMATGITADFVAMDIRRSLFFLGEIVGEVSSDDLLEKIFSSFCIGK